MTSETAAERDGLVTRSVRVRASLWNEVRVRAVVERTTVQTWVARVLAAAVNGEANAVKPLRPPSTNTPQHPPTSRTNTHQHIRQSTPATHVAEERALSPALAEWDEKCVCGHSKRSHLLPKKNGEVGRCDWPRGCEVRCREFRPVASAARAGVF